MTALNPPNRTRTHSRLAAAVITAALLGVLILACAASVSAQGAGGQFVESLEAQRVKIEGILRERLNQLIPSQNYVLKVNVQGERTLLPPREGPGAIPELPGFRQTAAERRAGEEKFRITQVSVRIVVGEDLPEAEVQYLRSIVPIVADFDPARGDVVEVQVISPKQFAEGPAPATGPEAAMAPGLPAFSITDWIMIGLISAALLLLLVLLFRGGRQPKVMPAPPMPAAAPPAAKAAELSEEDKAAMKRQEEERELESLRKDVVRGLAARPDLARQLVRDWQTQPKNLIALVQALGPSVSRQTLLPQMDRPGYQTLEDATRKEKPADNAALIKMLREANLFLVTQELAKPEEIRPDPFVFLGEMSRGQIAHLVKEEPVRVKAIVLSRIAPEDMAHILESYPKEMQLEVAVQIGNFHALPLDAVSDIARNLAEKARKVPDEKTVDIEGPKALVDLMSRASTGTIRYLLDAMKAKDRKLSAEIEKRFFLFDAIPFVPEEAMPQVVRRLPSQVVLQAIQGSDPALQRKVIMAFPEQARTGIVTSLRGAKFDAKTVMEARQQLVERFQQAASEGRFDLKAVIDAWQNQAKAS